MDEAKPASLFDSMPSGNLIGRYDGLRPGQPVLAIGSHLDTVPDAGKYDGVLGVLLGVAALRALGGRRLPFPIDVIAFSEEEGRPLPRAFLGSLAAAGRFDRQLLDQTDAAGITMADAFRSFGLDPARIDEAAYPAGGLLGYVEAHIEQGPVLETLGAPAGVVEAIAGQSRLGPNYAGGRGTPGPCPWTAGSMRLRRRPSSSWRSSGLARSKTRPASDGGGDGRRARGFQCHPWHGAVQHRRPPRYDPVRVAAVAEILAQASAIAGYAAWRSCVS